MAGFGRILGSLEGGEVATNSLKRLHAVLSLMGQSATRVESPLRRVVSIS